MDFCPIPQNPLHVFSQTTADKISVNPTLQSPTTKESTPAQAWPASQSTSLSVDGTADAVTITPIPASLSLDFFIEPYFTSSDSQSSSRSESLPRPPIPPIKRSVPTQPSISTSTVKQVSPADTAVDVFRITITKPPRLHPSREFILRSNLRHLPFTPLYEPRRAGSSSTTRFAAPHRGQEGSQRATEVPISDEESNDDHDDDDDDDDDGVGEDSGPTKGWEHMYSGFPSQSRRDKSLKTKLNTRPGFGSRRHSRAKASTNRSRDLSNAESNPRLHSVNLSLIKPKRIGEVTLAIATHWTSELGTFQYLFHNSKIDDSATNRLWKLLTHINDRKRDVSSQVMKAARFGLVPKLEFFEYCTAFGEDCRQLASQILDYWRSSGVVES